MQKRTFSTKYMTLIAIFSATAYVLVLLSKVIPNVAGFLSYEPKDVVIVMAGFMLGPAASFLISLIVSLIEMFTVSSTGPYGLLMNVLSTCAFAIPAVLIYRGNRTRGHAIAGLACGVILMAACMLIWNYTVTPFYMGVDRTVVAGMLLPVFLPFNLVKGGLNAALTVLLYKPIVGALRSAKLVEESPSPNARKVALWEILAAAAALATLVLLFLMLAGVIR